MRIDLISRAGTGPDLWGKRVVVIDVLRASSTIITALTHGCQEIIPVVAPEEAWAKLDKVGPVRPLLGGERGGLRIPGFDLGNSPLEYTTEKVNGRSLIFCTSNGTKALKEAEGAEEVLVGCFLNLFALISYLISVKSEEVVLFCAGSDGKPAREDLLCAGAIAQGLSLSAIGPLELSARAREEMVYPEGLGPEELGEALVRTDHGRHLVSLGFAKDVRYCGRTDTHPHLALYKDGSLRLRAQ